MALTFRKLIWKGSSGKRREGKEWMARPPPVRAFLRSWQHLPQMEIRRQLACRLVGELDAWTNALLLMIASPRISASRRDSSWLCVIGAGGESIGNSMGLS